MACKKNYKTSRLQFVVGDADSVVTDLDSDQYILPADGQTQLAFNITKVVRNSIECFLDGSIMPMQDVDQVSYDATYGDTQSIVTFFTGVGTGVSNGQQFIVRLNWVESI